MTSSTTAAQARTNDAEPSKQTDVPHPDLHPPLPGQLDLLELLDWPHQIPSTQQPPSASLMPLPDSPRTKPSP